MEAVVLAGGLGTRLRSVVTDIPKPMAPIRGVPFLEYVVRDLQQAGVRKIVLSVGYKHETIQAHFGERFLDIEIAYVIEDQPLGTGGAIKKAMKAVSDPHPLIVNGDTLFRTDVRKLDQFHRDQHARLTMALKPMTNFDRYGTVDVDAEGRITAFREKEFRKSGSINAGIYCLDRVWFQSLNLPERFSIEEDVFQKYYQNELFYGVASSDYFIDIGIPEDYQKAQTELPALENLKTDR